MEQDAKKENREKTAEVLTTEYFKKEGSYKTDETLHTKEDAKKSSSENVEAL